MSGNDDAGTDPSEGDAGGVEDPIEDPVDGLTDGVDAFDDDAWADAEGAEEAPPREGISPVAMVLGAIAVLGLIIVLVATGGSGSDDPSRDDSVKTESKTDASGETATTVKRGPAWPAIVQGRPEVFGQIRQPIANVSPDAEPGVYLWTDYDGWHVWAVDPSGKAAAQGTITSNVAFEGAALAADGQGTVQVDGTTLTFDVAGSDAKAAGINFNLGFYATEITVNLNGTDLPLLLGSKATPSPLPAVISKAVQPS